jgi:hypothetical protein
MTGEERQYLTDEYTVSEIPTIRADTYDPILEGVGSVVHDLYGPRWVWYYIFHGMHPDGGDFELQVWTPPRISSSGLAREMAKALGADVTKGARVDLGALRGRQVRLVVALDEEKGRNKVVSVMPTPVAHDPDPTPTAVDPDFEAWKAEQAAKNAANAQEPPMPEPSSGDDDQGEAA